MLDRDAIIARNNVRMIGSGPEVLMLAHGFGCDQGMWRYLASSLEETFQLVLFDYVGSGRSDLSAFSESRYASLQGYARDVNEICEALDLRGVHFVGHSVSGTIGLLAAINDPSRFSSQIMVCPSPCFFNDPPDYQGGFEHSDLHEMIDLMDRNHLGWARFLAPLVIGGQSSLALTGELTDSFCSTDPLVAKTFARATFFSDYRDILPRAQHPALILQSKVDSLANESVGRYVHAHLPHSTLRILPTEGHCIHMTHPELVKKEILAFLEA